MIISNTIEQEFDRVLLQTNQEKLAAHKSSGRLSASMLGMPVQWQVLKSLGIQQPEKDAFTLRKFRRGEDVENTVVEVLQKSGLVLETQKEINYRGVIGFLDIILDGNKLDFNKQAIMPTEVKSITNAAFKWTIKRNEPYAHHMLQAGLYALGLKLDYFSILYIASDDLRPKHFIVETKDVKEEIDNIIDEYNTYMGNKEIPLFTAIEKWQENKEYNNYPEWSDLTVEELAVKAKQLFTDQIEQNRLSNNLLYK